MDGDARGFRVALTADRYVNPEPGGFDGLAVLDAEGWGVMQLPAADYPAATRTHEEALAVCGRFAQLAR